MLRRFREKTIPTLRFNQNFIKHEIETNNAYAGHNGLAVRCLHKGAIY
jgi:hypothetical protein